MIPENIWDHETMLASRKQVINSKGAFPPTKKEILCTEYNIQ